MELYAGATDAEAFAGITKRNPGKILLLDEAGYVTKPLHHLLERQYKVIVYASLGELPFSGLTKLNMPHGIEK